MLVRSRAPSPEGNQDPEARSDVEEEDMTSDTEVDECSNWEELDDEDFGTDLVQWVIENDPTDDTWIPAKLKNYVKSPDVMSKFRFQELRCCIMPSRTLSPAITTLPMADACENRLEGNLRDGEDAAQGSTASHREREPIEEGEAPAPASGSAEEIRVDRNVDESWEDELIEEVQGQSKIRDWSLLRKKLKDDLQNKSRTLPLTRVNQFMILINFATLRLKGFSRIDSSLQIARQWHEGSGNWFARHVRALARHYQLFEVLPIEKRGGSANAHSWLHNEAVQKRTQDWLVTQPIGATW